MYKPSKTIFILLTLVLVLSACIPTPQPAEEQPAAGEQPALVDVQAQIATSVALTVAAQDQIDAFVAQTMAAQQAAVPLPSATPIPSVTPPVLALVPATITPWMSGGAGGGGGGGGGGGSGGSGSGGPGSPKYDCALIDQKPRDGDRIWRPGDSFDVVWTLKNTGTETIKAGYPFQYLSGDKMSPTGMLQLMTPVKPGDTFQFRIEVVAPPVPNTEKHQFTMQWAFIVEGNKICKPYISIFVQRQ